MEEKSLLDLVTQVASEQIALIEGEKTVTYHELIRAVDTLASEYKSLGVGREDVVALDLVPSIRTIVAMLAADRCDAAFMPIDPRESAKRKNAMFAVVRPRVTVTNDSVAVMKDAIPLDQQLPPRRGRAAYVSFTSGSTGEPKAVVTEHPAIVNYIEAVVAEYGIAPGDRQLQFSSIAFDIAIEEIFTTLCSGATLVLRDEEFIFNGVVEFLERCQERGITTLNLPTGVWNNFGMELGTQQGLQLPAALSRIIIGGEAAYSRAVDRWYAAAAHQDFRIFNTYGPTEAAVAVTLSRLQPGNPVTIGKPLRGVTITLVDAQGGSVTDGEIGEIVIGGIAVGRGYLNPANNHAFRETDSGWSYFTGDTARLTASNQFEFHGRRDAQIKVRGGYRVNPAEVRHALQSQQGVVDAYVLPVRQQVGSVLFGFVVPTGNEHSVIDTAQMREQLGSSLPEWMVPYRIITIASIPLTTRGKVDEQELLKLAAATKTEFDNGDVEELVNMAWEHALGSQPQALEQNFFESGGDSLAALELMTYLQHHAAVVLSMPEFYRSPTKQTLVDAVLSQVLGESIPNVHHTTGRTLVKLRRGGTGRLWCFLPPLSGAVTRYAKFASTLPLADAVWALETPAEMSNQGMSVLIAGLAKEFLREDLSAFDSIIFSGYSLGGVFAHEMARTVEPLVQNRPGKAPQIAALLLDPPDPTEQQLTVDEAFEIFVRVGWRIPEDSASFINQDGSYSMAEVAAAARRAGTLLSSADDREISDSWQAYESNAKILHDYVIPQGIKQTRLLQCLEDGTEAAGRWHSSRPVGSWAEVVEEHHAAMIPVEHFQLLEPPNDAIVLDWLLKNASDATAGD